MIIAGDRSILKLLGSSLREILIRDDIDSDKTQWPSFGKEVYEKMTTDPTPEKVYAMLIAFHASAKSMQYNINESRNVIDESAKYIMPKLQDLAQNMLGDLNPVNFLILNMIMKIYYRMVRIDLPSYFRDADVNKAWMGIHLTLLESSL